MQLSKKRVIYAFAVCLVGSLAAPSFAQTTAPTPSQPIRAEGEALAPPLSLFVVHLTTGSGWNKQIPTHEQSGFREHSANLSRLRTDGVLVIGARYKDSQADKGMLLLRAANVDAARAYFADDPMVKSKAFELDIAEFQPFYDGYVARPSRPATANESPLNRLSWLAGCWTGKNGKMEFREHWMRPAGGMMMGMGRTLVDGKASQHEAMRIEIDASGTPIFIAKPSGQTEGTFKLAKSEGNQFTFENVSHDFPQRVIYQLKADGSLHARIEGTLNGKARGIDFPMRRANCE